jgi:tetratricopeptide (TPR) repeat protein
VELYRRTQYDEAIAQFTKAIDLVPAPPPVFYQRGIACARANLPEDAIRDFKSALKGDAEPLLVRNLHYNLGLAYEKCNDPDQAVEWYGRTIEDSPRFANAYCNRGGQLFELGRYDEAITDLNRALELNPTDFIAYWNRALALRSQGHPEKAAADLEAFLKFSPSGHPLRARAQALL